MATVARRTGIGAAGAAARAEQVTAGVRFDWAMAAVCAWPLIGGYADAWAHNHLALDTFFTPWHAVLYSGFLAVALTMGGLILWNRARGYEWRAALPAGYGLTALGVALVFVGGPGDLLWHLAFGIERHLDAAVSPTHLLLGLAIGLIVSGPLRAAWHRRGEPTGWAAWGPALVSLACTLSAFTLITQYAHPFVVAYASPRARPSDEELAKAVGLLGTALQTALLMGLVLLALRRWPRLPFGALALVFTLNAVLLSFMQDHREFIPVALAAGVLADTLVLLLRPSIGRPLELRLFAAAVPLALYVLYFAALMLTGGIWWTVHLWLGACALAGFTGFFLSYLVAPPPLPMAVAGEQAAR